MIQFLKPMKYLSLTIPGLNQPIQAPGGIPQGGFTDGSTTGNEIVGWALGLAFMAASIFALFMIVYGGVQWLISGGDKEKIAAARKRIIFAVIGLCVVLFSVFMINLVLYFLGAPLLTTTQEFSCQTLNQSQCEVTPECSYSGNSCSTR